MKLLRQHTLMEFPRLTQIETKLTKDHSITLLIGVRTLAKPGRSLMVRRLIG